MNKLLFLTKLDHETSQEDKLLIAEFRNVCEVTVCHPLKAEKYENSVQAVFIRNIWPTHEYRKEYLQMLQRFRKKNLRVYNPLSAKADMWGKEYLFRLFERNYPVIPTASSIQGLKAISQSKQYFVKPLWGCSGSGTMRLSHKELVQRNPQDCLIQPFLEFTEELMFYFLDNDFHHAFMTANRLTDREKSIYQASDEDMQWAKQFVNWNNMPYGLQRIDALRTISGDLLLTEVEDVCPFLFLMDMEIKPREKFVHDIVKSVSRHVLND